ncbi:hypothetical protein QWY85_06110 [Neolewinella lacunae]|uniref:Uncharacterized protein n=1 Tax=Neolewinella lacunae TaxID=1517758 RepID=A0A923PNG6_9BACT|nr:hypothetical protein [Neolewinella lacunae]MBC6994534.1 hypothetical protein [Neolewinella lacunae]MDN3634227.1 hypothetical protein [Neolewinella lacunae]
MKQLVIGCLLSFLLLAQAAKNPLLLQWQQWANESFTELFCINKGLEDIPMCFGSCQLPALFQGMESDQGDDELQAVLPLATVLYCMLPSSQRENPVPNPVLVPQDNPVFVPSLIARHYVGTVFEPPIMG